jgi:Ras-related GTP-binding protein C/D
MVIRLLLINGFNNCGNIDVKMDISRKMQEYLADTEQEDTIHLTYHATSIYDWSIYEAMSKIIQKLIPVLLTLEKLLDVLRNVKLWLDDEKEKEC